MTSPTSSPLDNDNDDDHEETLIERLRRRALLHVRPSRRERALVRMLARTNAINAPLSLEPPAVFREVLRRPKGGQHHLVIDIDGRPHGLVLNSQGIIDPERENFLWRWVIARAQRRGSE